MSEDVGCFELGIFGVRWLVIFSEERFMEVVKHRPYVVQRPFLSKASSDSIGAEGVFSAEGDNWKHEHKLVAAALNKLNVQDYLAGMKSLADRLVRKWDQLSADGDHYVPIVADLGSISADAIAKSSMDKDFDFLNHPESKTAKDINISMEGFVSRSLAPFCFSRIPIIGQYLDGCGWSIKRLKGLIGSIITEYEKHGIAEEGEAKRTFLHKVYAMMKSENLPSRTIAWLGT